MKFVRCIAAMALLIALSSLGFAETPVRSGFYLSGGLGLQSTSLDAELGDIVSGSEVNFGGLTTAKAGYYVLPRVAVYGLSENSWWFDTDADSWVTVGIAGIGSTYYFRDYLGPYVEIGVGFSYLRDLNRSNDSNGGAFSFGVRAEVRPNIQFGVVYIVSQTEERLTSGSASAVEKFSSNILALKLEFKL